MIAENPPKTRLCRDATVAQKKRKKFEVKAEMRSF
jgi:hypothetical protein